MCDDVYSDLANAVVQQAVEDWQNAVDTIRKMKHSTRCHKTQIVNSAKRRKDDCESFFKSQWFELLTNLDGRQLLKDLKKRDKDRQKAKFNKVNIAG
ncbi:hypothetical protein [Fibrobacter sp.]|uniref:hypothetical protein n=1 Tax=Fibrobacter sp. TaxID=35828 RepID=UPI00388F4109